MAVRSGAPAGPRPVPDPLPDPVHESPPADRYCDLILNGGVASGVVYPWALVELARHYRFRNIGGNSIGAMAAAIAAAAEYGRCCGQVGAFEVLRRVPLDLAEERDGRTTMLRLFQPGAGLARLFELLLLIFAEPETPLRRKLWRGLGLYGLRRATLLALGLGLGLGALLLVLDPTVGWADLPRFAATLLLLGASAWGAWRVASWRRAASTPPADSRPRTPPRAAWRRVLLAVGLLLALALVAMALHALGTLAAVVPWVLALLGAVAIVSLVMLGLAWHAMRQDLSALKANDYGLCSGRSEAARQGRPDAERALIEWLHEGIQRSAGRGRDDPPLTFEDLWRAPRPGMTSAAGDAGRNERSITLEMFSTLLTLGRPVRWPLRDDNQRLYFVEKEWERLFPPTLLKAVVAASRPYVPASPSDPEEPVPTGAKEHGLDFREIPAEGLPIAVAARISMSFPILFSAVPVYAVDYEGRRDTEKERAKWKTKRSGKAFPVRRLRRCLMVDGGLCTNFPIHLFDAAHPRWPTFGLMLSRRIAPYKEQAVWLPKEHLDGRADNWQRHVPGAEMDDAPPGPANGLRGLLWTMFTTALDWSDNLTTRLPHVRNRVLRMALKSGEGQLNIAMPGHQVLRMAHEYGTVGGRLLVERFAPVEGRVAEAWREHLYVRAMMQLRSLRRHLAGYGAALARAGYSVPLDELLDRARHAAPLSGLSTDPLRAVLTSEQVQALKEATAAVAALETALDRPDTDFGAYRPVPAPELRQRSVI